MTHQRLEDVGEEPVKDIVGFRKDAVVMDVIVYHESEGTGVPYRHQRMHYAVDVVEIVKQADCTRERGCEVNDEVGEEYHIGRVADDGSRPREVFLEGID